MTLNHRPHQTCPTALDVTVYDRLPVARTQRHHHRPQVQDVLRIFVWSDSTLAEVGALLARRMPVCRARGCRVLYGLRRPNSTRNTVRRCGYTRTDGEGAEDARTLAQCGFRAGDTLCVAAERWSFHKEKRARHHAEEDAREREQAEAAARVREAEEAAAARGREAGHRREHRRDRSRSRSRSAEHRHHSRHSRR